LILESLKWITWALLAKWFWCRGRDYDIDGFSGFVGRSNLFDDFSPITAFCANYFELILGFIG
jgi:hypothetical protein